ncbi:LamG domain-containing protein [Cyclobacterium amurskyense]|uniref:LamG-like jellyroll fold domain-containing protein n=1 Tax=Cyclobacterium amurskyense TaxID=320787 RepID=A0A0H4PAT4_9BACT|nr:LamG-like jellyroll fold domain-containing protein [Cyclobacterium amurskyense]AKP49873.1 hypothetical protein CA2015_0399 [Cyclobacterium amurskyense]
MQTAGNSNLGGEVFLVSNLREFPAETCSLSLWTQKASRLFFGAYDTGSSFEDTQTFLDLNIYSGGMEVNFSGNSVSFSGATYPRFRPGESHHLAITLQVTLNGYAVSCYVNAVLVATKTVQILNGINEPMRLLKSGPLYIGNAAPDLSQDGQFGDLQESRGAFSELHIYGNVLSAEEINLDALGEIPEGSLIYLNMPLDDLHHDRRLGIWHDTIQPYYHAQELIRTDNNPNLVFNRDYSKFPLTDRSVAFWVRCREGATGALISYGDVSSSDHPNDGGSTWLLENPGNLRLGDYSSGIQLGTGSWNHIVIVEDTRAGSTSFYLNGKPSTNSPASFVIEGVITNQPLVLGARRATDDIDSIFTGELVDLYIWSRALTPLEVSEMARGVVPNTSDPSLVDHQLNRVSEVREDLSDSGKIFLPMLDNEVKFPLLSNLGTMQALQVSPTKGGMRTLVYNDLTGDEFSLEFWVKINTEGYVIRGINNNNQVDIALFVEGGAIIVLINDRVTGEKYSSTLHTGGKILSEWHHVAITISNSVVVGYLDGQEGFTNPLAHLENLSLLGDQFYLQFGNFNDEEIAFDGSFAEIRLWNRTLSVGEIRHRMYHSLLGNEFGLIGRWAFENALGRDSSSKERHAFPVGKPVFIPLSDIDLEPIDSPYLVAQVSLIEDYHFEEDKISPRNSYRLNITAFDENDRPLSGANLAVGIQAEPGNPFQQTNVLIEDSGKSEAHPIGINQPYVLTTNSQGIISFALPAEALMAPVLRITAPFMEKNHALLVFPDRQAHHKLSQVTEEELLNKKVVMEAGGQPKPMVPEEHRDSAPHLAQAIRHLMGAATEKTPQSNSPVVRPVPERLREVVIPPAKRRYENATASPDAYDPNTDVIAGYAVGAEQTGISRSLTVNQMPDWEFRKNEAGTFVVDQSPRERRTRNLAQIENLAYADDFTRLLLTSVDGRQRSGATASYSDLIAAIDQGNRLRSFFDLFTAIKDAVSFVVHTVEKAYNSVKETIRVAVVYITDALDKVIAVAIHTVEHALDAVKGVLAKVGATVVGAINFVKELFDWTDILKTQTFTEQLLRSAMAASRANLSNTKNSTLTWVEGLKTETHDWLEKLKSNAANHKSSIKSEAAPGNRSNVKGSYLSNLVGNHGKDATLEGEWSGPDPTQAQENLNKIRAENSGNVSHIESALGNLQLFSGSEYSMSVVIDRLIDLLETIADGVFDLMKAGIEWFFSQLDLLLEELDKILAYRINLPLVTRLYEEVITGNGSQLTLYNLSALLGAIPTTITYKLATGADHGPFHGEELTHYRNIFEQTPTNVPANQEELIRQQKASLGLGGCFLGFIAITGVFNTILNVNPNPPTKLKWIGFALNGVFQLTQFPLGSTFNLVAHSGAASSATEETIWAVQFFPWVLEGISASGKYPASQRGFDIATTVYGGVHAALFITVFGLEMADPESDKVDSGIKIVANLASCIPELTILVPQPIVRVLVNTVALTAWEALSLIRYFGEVKSHHNFLVR